MINMIQYNILNKNLVISLLSIIVLSILFSLEAFSQDALLTLSEIQQKKLYKSIDEALEDPSDVYRLNLQGSGITTLPEEFSKFENYNL